MSEQESSLNVEAVEQMYWRNPILRYTQHPLHSPLLPLPYGDVSVHCECYELLLSTSVDLDKNEIAIFVFTLPSTQIICLYLNVP